MDEKLEIVTVDDPDAAWGIIGQGISDFNRQQTGGGQGQVLCFVVQGPGQEVAGGVIAQIYWDWLYVDLMWLKDELRGRGYGSRLLALVEEEARKRGAKHAFLDTFSFQAPGFYQKHGYRVFGELQDFPPGHTRYYLTKTL